MKTKVKLQAEKVQEKAGPETKKLDSWFVASTYLYVALKMQHQPLYLMEKKSSGVVVKQKQNV
jgi:hypothetical protein